MKVWKRNAVAAAIVLFVCAAVYLNWSYSQSEAALASEGVSSGKTLGEAELVDSKTELTLSDAETAELAQEGIDPAEQTMSRMDDYFAAARLNREQARDSALAILQRTVSDPNADAAAVSAATESITAMAAETLKESEIENLVTSKGYKECVAFIGDNTVSVVVDTADRELEAADIARITDIVCGQTDFSAGSVKVIPAQSEMEEFSIN